IVYIAGVATPSDILLGLESGYRHFKLFPAAVLGGVSYLQALRGPFPHVQFCPTGGIDADNARHYLSQPNVLCVGMTGMINMNLIERKDWDALKLHVTAHYQKIKSVRQ